MVVRWLGAAACRVAACITTGCRGRPRQVRSARLRDGTGCCAGLRSAIGVLLLRWILWWFVVPVGSASDAHHPKPHFSWRRTTFALLDEAVAGFPRARLVGQAICQTMGGALTDKYYPIQRDHPLLFAVSGARAVMRNTCAIRARGAGGCRSIRAQIDASARSRPIGSTTRGNQLSNIRQLPLLATRI